LRVSEELKEGVKKFDDVKAEIKTALIREKKMEIAKKAIDNVKAKIGGDLSKANSVDGNARFGTTTDFTISGNIPGLGLDYAFSQEAYKAKQGVITGPVKGMRGYYLLKVTSKTAFDNAAYQAQRNTLRDQILSEKRSTLFSQFFQTIKENGDIEDSRYKFFGRN
jgi:parvulin-like peptidyl-prolyl isomerase